MLQLQTVSLADQAPDCDRVYGPPHLAFRAFDSHHSEKTVARYAVTPSTFFIRLIGDSFCSDSTLHAEIRKGSHGRRLQWRPHYEMDPKSTRAFPDTFSLDGSPMDEGEIRAPR